MVKEYLDCGTVVNTHGVKGEIKINPEADSPAFLLQFHTLYLNRNPYEVTSARVHKGCVIAKLSGVDTIEAAQTLRGMTVSFARKDAKLEPNFEGAKAYDSYQFVRNGFFCIDSKDSRPEALVFNRIVPLKSSFKINK